MKPIYAMLLTLLLACNGSAAATDTSTVSSGLSSAQLLRQSNEIAKELRCPKTINQSLYESESQIAHELKGHIYQMLQQGQSKQEITQFMVERYGEQMHYRPGLSASTMMLWFGPLMLLVMAIGLVLFFIRQQGRAQQHQSEDR
ncbi:MAG: cytochrome c-type biogenesis protein [Shewanella sp.]